MALSKARLDSWKEVMCLKIRLGLKGNYVFYDLRDKGDICDRSVVVWIVRVQPLALENRNQHGSLSGRSQITFTGGVHAVTEDGDK